ncbi:hypothetical protein [Phnomibacter sp. MR]|uniref:hypothetical protein n=1 Tax=Phnomibacter sp. MR TaxID=3042318 RepID=UPI003A7FFD8B
MKFYPKPTHQSLLDETILITFYVPGKTGYEKTHKTCQSPVEAGIVLSHLTALWILYPLASWLRSQEHVCSVMQMANAARRKPIGRMHSQVSKLMAHPTTMPHHVADWLQLEGLQLMAEAMPGRSSRYYMGSLALQVQLQQYATQYASGTIEAPSPNTQEVQHG